MAVEEQALVAPPLGISAWVALLRPRQWVKNGFVLAPLVFAGALDRPGAIGMSLAATALFCLASSAVYVLNDLLDAPKDRKHPTKRLTRPIAAGTVTPRGAWLLLVVLLAALGGGLVVVPQAAGFLGLYLALNVAYSVRLKHVPVLDLFCIASGFVLRVWVGAVVLAVPLSSWMANTTLCLALYLAAAKRRQELALTSGEARAVLEAYSLPLLDRFAQTAATAAIVFYGMFTATVRPELASTVILVIFGFFRYQYLVERREGGESPTDVLWRDLPLGGVVLLWAALAVWIMRT